jgi:uncharacterized protein (TIGR01244 family)
MGTRPAFIVFAGAVALGVSVAAQQATRENVPGIRNLSRLETTVACAGATEVEAIPAVKKMGFAAIINLRQASEEGARIAESTAAAKAAGLNYVHIPFDGAAPDPAVADRFIAAITDPANQPAYIHCAGANRAATMWMIKRLVVDKWDADRAAEEAKGLGMTNAAHRQFAIDYAARRRD